MTRAITAAACGTVLVAALAGQEPREVVAIRGARIVTAAGSPLEHGTVVMRDGSIDAVGESVAVPRDATVIDGSGLTVYPGLIDLANTAATEQAQPQPLQNPRTTAQVQRWKQTQLMKPQARAADIVKIDDAEMARLASNGITSVVALPPGEVISGQSALVNVTAPPETPPVGAIAASRRNLVIVKTPVALHVSMPSRPRVGTNAYPVSLMGVLAFIRQAFTDAQYYGLQLAQHRAPPDDPALAAMQPALDRKMPVAFEADRSREIVRALGFAREFNLDPIITGAREAGSVTPDLIAARARVIVSLNYPQRSRALAPDDDEPLRDIEARANAPKTAAALAAAGVRFGFGSSGLTDSKDFVRNAAKAVRQGLAPEAAVRALTADAAAIAGVADTLGTIERGKMANLIVTDGDLFADQTTIVRVFVNGQAVALDRSAPPETRRNPQGR
jgi:imidazolonepropionase-like amidohydrolase